MPRIDKKINKEKFEKQVLRDLRRYKELLKEEQAINKIERTTNVPTLVIIEDTGISDENKAILSELLTYLNVDRIYNIRWSYDKHTNRIYIPYTTAIPKHLLELCDYHILTGYSIKKYYSNYLKIEDRPITYYGHSWKYTNPELNRLDKKLWHEGNAFKVLHIGHNAWAKIEKKYKRSKNKTELLKSLDEIFPDDET